MTKARLRIHSVGPHVSVQDLGRPGFRRFGVTASGPMDRLAFRAANLALGNPADAAALEVSLGGLTLECLSDELSLAVAGGGFVLETAEAVSGWQVFPLRKNQTLTLRPGPWGSWCYLAFAGRLETGEWLGSASTHGGSGRGGGKIVAGSEIGIDQPELRPALHRPIPCPVFARPRHMARVVMGPQERFFSPEARSALLENTFFLTSAYDRMGVRLQGVSLEPSARLSIPSEPIPRGAIQVAGDGVATILLADHQTTGGYPKIACVLDADMDALVQLRSRDALGFAEVSPERAIEIARLHALKSNSYLNAIRAKPAT